jgi:hypothetical protein
MRVLFMGIRQTNDIGNRPTSLYGPEDSDEDSWDDSSFDMRQAFDRLFSIEAGDNVIKPIKTSPKQEKAFSNLSSDTIPRDLMEEIIKDQPPKRKPVESPPGDEQLSKRSKSANEKAQREDK